MTIRNLAVIGECMIELSQQSAQLTRGFGGDTLNTAVYLARQMPEQALQVHYVTALGTDSFSGEMLQAWRQEKIETGLIQQLENKLPGLYVIETDAAGERTFYYWRNDAAARYWLAGPRPRRCAPGWRSSITCISAALAWRSSRPPTARSCWRCCAAAAPTAARLSSTTTTARACGKAVRKLS